MNRYCYEHKMYDIKLSNLEKAIMEEIISNMYNYDEEFEDVDILAIARTIIARHDPLWELLNGIICNYLEKRLEVE